MNNIIYKCGMCKKPLDYPPVKVPLGPVTFGEEDIEAKRAGLDVTKGIIRYSRVCVHCAIEYLNRVGEQGLRRS